jgi:hypothetical protein
MKPLVRGGRQVSGLAKQMLRVVLVCQVGIAVPGQPMQHPGLAHRPEVAMPACSAPKPFHVEHWTAASNRFLVSLASTIGRDDAGREASRLAELHNFEIDGSGNLSGGAYAFSVRWLEPAQVAALRCESAVAEIDLRELTEMTSVGRH